MTRKVLGGQGFESLTFLLASGDDATPARIKTAHDAISPLASERGSDSGALSWALSWALSLALSRALSWALSWALSLALSWALGWAPSWALCRAYERGSGFIFAFLANPK